MLIKTEENAKYDGLSRRGAGRAKEGKKLEFWKKILGDTYDPDTNPNGIVNIGTAENYAMLGETAEYVNEHLKLDTKDFSYGTGPFGTARLREVMAKHITRHFHAVRLVQPDELLFANGVTAICEMLGFSICDPGDQVLMSRPIYQAFKIDFKTKAEVDCRFVSFGTVDQFSLDGVRKYEEAILEDRSSPTGGKIKAIIMCHPHNPLGRCYKTEALIEMMKLCDRHSIHLLMDEIYALSAYHIPGDPEAVQFKSSLSLDVDKYIRPEYFHLLYGMSKDTAGGGLRLGCIYTRNEQLMRSLQTIGMFAWSGNASDRIAVAMLENEEWIDGYLERGRAKLAERNLLARQLLTDNGIPFLQGSNAGFFLWLDLRRWAKGADGHEDRWAGEDALTSRLLRNKVFITNGKELSAEEPGWYRLIFSQDERIVREGVKRVVQVLNEEPGQQ